MTAAVGVLPLLALLVGCLGTHLSTHHVVTGKPGPPYTGVVSVHMEGAPLPARYEEVALVQAEGAGENLGTLLPALRARAADLGCDALVLVKVDQGPSHASATGVAVRTLPPANAPTSSPSSRSD